MESNVPKLKTLVLDLLKFHNKFNNDEFQEDVLDDISSKVESIVKNDVDQRAKQYIEETYLDKFDLQENFKDSIIDKIFDEWELDGDLYTIYDTYYDQDDKMYDIKGVVSAYCELIETRLEHLYIGVINNAEELENDYGPTSDDDGEDNEYNIHFEILEIKQNKKKCFTDFCLCFIFLQTCPFHFDHFPWS